jgi:hypothetical protein
MVIPGSSKGNQCGWFSSTWRVQGGSISIWHDEKRELKHVLYCYHELQPPMQSEALGMRATVQALAPVIPASAAVNSTTGERALTLVAIMSHGQLWRWSIPLPALPVQTVVAPVRELTRGAPLAAPGAARLKSCESLLARGCSCLYDPLHAACEFSMFQPHRFATSGHSHASRRRHAIVHGLQPPKNSNL